MDSTDTMRTNTKTMSWLPLAFICFGLGILGIIASVIVISLITLYLSPKGTDLAVDNTINEVNTFNTVFATNLKNANGYSVVDVNSLAGQINQYLNTHLYKLGVQTASFGSSASSVTNLNQRKKRQTGAALSCNAETAATYQALVNGDKMVIVFYLDKQQTKICKHGYCNPNKLAFIKSQIASKFGSTSVPLTVKLTSGITTSITTLFCSFGSVTTCSDGIQNQDETSIDCGGSCTAQNKACGTGLNCKVASDCGSYVCTQGICQASTCFDGVQNQGETQSDCGGPCVGRSSCANGLNCNTASDCVSNYCYEGTCMISTSCFIAGTPILLADGSGTLPIEQTQINTQLLGINGEINTVLAMRSQSLNGRTLYGLNGEQPFATPEHPFRSPYSDSIRLVFDADFTRINRPDLAPDTIQQIEVGTELLRFNVDHGQFDIVVVDSILQNENALMNTTVYHFVTDSPSGVLGVVAHNYLTSNEWYDFHNYAAAIYYQIGVATPIVAELQTRYLTYINSTQLNITVRNYNNLVAVAVAERSYTALLNRVSSLYPPANTQAYQMAWKTLAVPASRIYENTPRGSGFNQVMKMKLIPHAAWLINLDPNGEITMFMQQAINDTLDWWHSTTEY